MSNTVVKQEVVRSVIYSVVHVDGESAGTSCASYNEDCEVLTISGWFVKDEYQGCGLGRILFAAVVRKYCDMFGTPESIQYIWNGVHEYVHDWLLRNFDAKCKCPIEVLKVSDKDSWDSHIYLLDVGRVMEYVQNIEVPFSEV